MPNFKKVNKISADNWKMDSPYKMVSKKAAAFMNKVKTFVVPTKKAAAPKFYSKNKK
tara:strand:+ start:45 stop:215 length:171 start_codon:yes stop_codon:yes gene_type:complete